MWAKGKSDLSTLFGYSMNAERFHSQPITCGQATNFCGTVDALVMADPRVGCRPSGPGLRANLNTDGCWLAWDGVKAVGLAKWQSLPWESTCMGLPMARVDGLWVVGRNANVVPDPPALEIKRRLVAALQARAAAAGVHHLVARLPALDRTGLAALREAGFEQMDVLVTLELKLRREAMPPMTLLTPGIVRPATSGDISTLRTIAASSFKHDWLHTDPLLPATTVDALYANWIERDINGRADWVWVAEIEGIVRGFAAGIRLDDRWARIDLVATDADWRHRGIAFAVIQTMLAHCISEGIAHAVVGTQAYNLAALALYQRMGFRPVFRQITLRKVLNRVRGGK